MLTLYSRTTNNNVKEVRTLRTNRTYVDLKDCIPSWCNIKSKEFKKILEIVKKYNYFNKICKI